MTNWHALTPEEAMAELKTGEKGLTAPEAQTRLVTYGPNELKKEKGRK